MSNDNHDEQGRFSSGGGGGGRAPGNLAASHGEPKQHPDASANAGAVHAASSSTIPGRSPAEMADAYAKADAIMAQVAAESKASGYKNPTRGNSFADTYNRTRRANAKQFR
jgi:hypothetical protein